MKFPNFSIRCSGKGGKKGKPAAAKKVNKSPKHSSFPPGQKVKGAWTVAEDKIITDYIEAQVSCCSNCVRRHSRPPPPPAPGRQITFHHNLTRHTPSSPEPPRRYKVLAVDRPRRPPHGPRSLPRGEAGSRAIQEPPRPYSTDRGLHAPGGRRTLEALEGPRKQGERARGEGWREEA